MATWKTGAVVMLDALGFKGIWKHYSLAEVLERLRLVERTVMALHDVSGVRIARLLGFEQQIAFLSDTIVIACVDAARPEAAVAIATSAAGYVMHAGATDTQEGRKWLAPLAYRGAIAFGQFYIEDRFIVGPAIDEAAGEMNRPEGAFAFLTDSARERYSPPGDAPLVAVEWDVPMKARAGADTCKTWVASPFAHDAGAPSDKWEIADEILKTFDRDTSPSVSAKRANTKAFLEAAYKPDAAHLRRRP